MKASVKVREDQKPLVRAKVPLILGGLPLYTGVTSGDPHELALHVGTYADAGPAMKFSYKPNDTISPFSILLKTGFGVWGSPQGAAIAMSAEVSLSSAGTPSFSFRLKPKFGDFGLRKDTRSIAVSFTSADRAAGEEAASSLSLEEDKLKSSEMGEEEKSRESSSIRALSYDGFSSPNASPTDLSPPGKQLLDGLGLNGGGGGPFSVKEKIQSFSNGPGEKSDHNLKSPVKPPNGVMEHFKDGSSDSGSIEDGFTPVFSLRHPHSQQDDRVVDKPPPEESRSGRVDSWIGASTNGWSMSAHSALPLGGRVVAKARWSVRFGSNVFRHLRDGFSITDIQLPTLSVDKLSIEAVDPFRRCSRGKRAFEPADIVLPGFDFAGEDSNQQMGQIAAMCVSMRYQLQLLHSENKVLRKTMDELRSEIAGKKLPAAKASEILMHEENALRSQLFDELSGKADISTSSKVNGKSIRGKDSSSKVESLDGLRPGGSKTPVSASSGFTVSVDPVSEELKKAIMNATTFRGKSLRVAFSMVGAATCYPKVMELRANPEFSAAARGEFTCEEAVSLRTSESECLMQQAFLL
ncbi:hypothetical protein R1sor_017834 [Riccia sorocarpa]|uniref:Peptidase S74 domain-containing protein n=1 Tax=Riccia sorocarpa TaxID=122646 RepID=A0ABD3I842_9MARC